MSKRSVCQVGAAAALALVWMPAVLLAYHAPGVGGSDPTGTESGTARLLDVELDAAAVGGPVVLLHSDHPLTYESFELDDPPRIVMDLSSTVSEVAQYRLPVGRDGVIDVRAGQHTLEPQPVTRVVIDLERTRGYSIEQYGSRVEVHFDGDEAEVPGQARAPADPDPLPVAGEPAALAANGLDQLLGELEGRNIDAPDPSADLAARSATEPVAVDAGFDPSVEPDVLEQLLSAPAYAAPQPRGGQTSPPASFATKRIVTDEVIYSGKRISLNLVDADLKQVFRLFHEISGLNFVLDPGVSGRVTIVLDQVPWDQALDIILKNNGLDKVLENNVLRIATTRQLAEEAAARRQLRDAQELEVEPVTLTRTLSYAKAVDVERVIQNGGILSTRGSVIVDERTNTLIISDVPKKTEPIDRLISTLDAETPQVMIEARIVETSRSYVRDLGVVWGVQAFADAAHGTATGLSFPHNVAAGYGLNLPGDGGASQLAFSLSNIVDSFTLDVALNALESEGRGRVLSSPKIATQNNERAEIEQGVRFPIVNTTATEINVEFVSASLRLMVTPQITAEGTIILEVEVENNSPDFVNTSGDVPSIRTQRAQTKVLISDGGTTVIGGIFTINEGQSEVGVPWFRKVPLFGWLFRAENITRENRELLIFITPKIVRLS